MPAVAPPLPSASNSTTTTALIVLMWIAWIAVIVVADFMAFMMFAFADSPGSAKAAKLMIAPIFLWFGITLIAGIFLLIFKGWWQVPLAFVLAISPPFVVFLGYNLLHGISATPTVTMPAAPAPAVTTPQGGFKPTISSPTQPDFQKRMREVTTPPSTNPAGPATQP